MRGNGGAGGRRREFVATAVAPGVGCERQGLGGRAGSCGACGVVACRKMPQSSSVGVCPAASANACNSVSPPTAMQCNSSEAATDHAGGGPCRVDTRPQSKNAPNTPRSRPAHSQPRPAVRTGPPSGRKVAGRANCTSEKRVRDCLATICGELRGCGHCASGCLRQPSQGSCQHGCQDDHGARGATM